MADKIFHSSPVTFVDRTDDRKLDVYISSNHPTVQLYNTNVEESLAYTPDWSVTNLKLEASFYVDSAEITPTSIEWSSIIGTDKTVIGNQASLIVFTNVLKYNPIITYRCDITYQNLKAFKEITFTRVDTGLNGSDGSSAPTVQAQYSVDGKTNWTPTLNAVTHKYIRYSYDGGKTWTTAIKMVGEDGTSVNIKGTATSKTQVSGTSYYTLVYNSTTITGATIGDAYLLDGNMYVCVDSRDGNDYFMDVGRIQGPQGNDGQSSYVFIRYATDANGANMTTSPSSTTTHIGICTVNANVAPTTANSYTWSKFVGDSAKSIILSGTSQIFKVSQNAIPTYTPTTITVTAQVINTTVATWEYSVNGGISWITTVPDGVSLNVGTNTLTITGKDLTSNTLVIRASNGVYKDIYTVYKVFDGVNGTPGNPGAPASMAFLTNENISFGANASGQVALTSFTTNVVAYTGTTKVTPTIRTNTDGTLAITGLPTGMTVATPVTTSDEQILRFSIANNSTLGSASSNNGTITIPIISPVSTNLMLSWSKINSGATGVGIKSTTVSYGSSDSSSTQPTEWQSTIPAVAEGKYLWTRTIIDYTDDNVPDTVTYIYAKQGSKGDTGGSGSSVTVASIQYQEGSSATTAPTGNWSNAVVAVADGKYLWTKTAFSDGKVAYGVAKQGEKGNTGNPGRGVSSIVEQYYHSTSATSQAGGSWVTTAPTWVDGKYIWTRSVITYTDTTTYTTSPICVTGQKGGTGGIGLTGVGVDSVDIWYYQSTSATALAGGSWSTSAPTWSDGKYVWTKTITTYTNNTTDETSAVCLTGQKGSTGVGIKAVTEHYLATSSSSGVTASTTGWTEAIQTITDTNKYLWNYETITYTNNTTTTTAPVIIGVFGNKGNTGKGIKSVTEYYLATTASSGVTTSTTGWKDTMQALSATNKYLWNYELITYTDNTTTTVAPVIIGVYGDQGIQGPNGNDAYTVILTNESHIFAGDVSNAINGTAETQVLAYNGATQQSVTIASVNGKTAATADTDTGIAGLKFKCSALSGTSPKITFTCTTAFVSNSGVIPIVLSVGGMQFTKMFTYSIAFKGTTGSPGSPGSPGTPASLVDITPSAHYFKSTSGKDGAFTPDYIYLYPRFQTVTYSKWEYSVNGGTSWTTVVSGSNGLTIGTYNSVANSLQIAKISALYTDSITSISFRCVSSSASVYDTVSIAKIYDVVDLQIGGRNYILNSANLSASGLGSVAGSRAEYRTIDVGQSYMNINSGTEVTISFDLEMTVNTANPNLTIYNGNRFGPKMITSKSIKFTAAVGDTIKQRCSVVTQITDRENPSLTTNTIEFYSTYDTSNWFKVSNLKLEVGNKATDWSPAPEDLKSTTFQLYAPKGYLITNDVPEVTLETFAYDGSQQITNATFAWSSWNGEDWVAISGTTGASLTLNKSNVLKSSVYKCEMTYGGKVYEATATVEDKTDVYDSLIHITSKYSSTNRLYWVLYSTVYSEEGERDELLGPIGTTAPSSPATGSYWYKVDETNYTVTLMKYSGAAWTTTTDKQELVYDWFLLNDVDKMITLGAQSKVKIVTANDFSRTCSVQCNVSDAELILLTHNNQILTDPSDPIISATAPSNPVNGQLWIKTNENGSYVLSVWDSSIGQWVVSEADTQNKVYVTKPTQYNTGDLWIVDSNYQPVAYDNGVAQTYKHTEKTMLRATATSQTYNDAHWVEALKYQKELDDVVGDVEKFKQFISIDDSGLIMQAKDADGAVSDFKTVLTNTELGFYQGSTKVAHINNNQLNISKAEITNGMVISGTTPELKIGNFVLIQESNGSLSIGLKS